MREFCVFLLGVFRNPIVHCYTLLRGNHSVCVCVYYTINSQVHTHKKMTISKRVPNTDIFSKNKTSNVHTSLSIHMLVIRCTVVLCISLWFPNLILCVKTSNSPFEATFQMLRCLGNVASNCFECWSQK